MRATLKFKLFAIVAACAVALITLTVWSGIAERTIETQVNGIRDTYLPKIRLRPELTAAFDRLNRTIQNAFEASDADLLAAATAEHDALVKIVGDAHDALTMEQAAALRFSIEEYYASAIATTRRLIAGEGGEATQSAVQDMQSKRARIAGQIEQATAFDEHALTDAFAAAKAAQHSATLVRIVVGSLCIVAVLAISIWIGTVMFASLGALIAGFERFGKNDFTTPIVTASRDELADVAQRANQMAAQLQRLDEQRADTDWVKRGLAGLGDELRGELAPRDVARRTIEYLARYVQAPVGALYHGPASGPYELLGSYALPANVAPPSFARGEGLVGEAAARKALTIVDATAGALVLRSGLVEVAPRSLVLAPIARGDSVTGVLELGVIRPWRQLDTELLERASETIAIVLEAANTRAATRELLDRTQRQAHELERAGATLEQRAIELARASAYKSQFLASMSHELRTPLNAIIGFSEIMYNGEFAVDPELAHEYLGDILSSGRHLLQLINDVLDLAKVEAGKLEFHPEPLALTRVLGEVLAVLRTTSAKQQIEVTAEIDPSVEQLVLDPGRLKQVLYNYVSNALKFTPPRGRVVVRGLASGPDRVRIEVVDTGSGIAADQIGRLFGDFQQTAEGAKRSDSTGLGLALTKRVVEAQGGEVGVTSKLGEGSTFFAILPRRTGEATRTIAASTLHVIKSTPSAPTILVVEDEPADRAQLTSALAEAGYTVESVATGAEALARCADRAYDAITLDLLLPDMTGLEVLQKLRAGKNGEVPVIVVTVVAERGAVAGFHVHDMLAKPLSEPALLASLDRAGVSPDGRAIVLVVDDDPTALKVMAASLGKLGYQAVCEADPVRGLRVASEQPPAAIVLDLIMPGMTGFEFLDQLRTTPTAHAVPVIVWTSKDLSDDERTRLRKSAHAVVSKGNEGNARVVAELAAVLPAKRKLVM
ncbi:MAG TPA: response regulator [Kofleriaceae bacterium]|jgi:signal transduction histidine kinase/DNA-binding response OmpR family regulator